jgi:hypothetical protein
MHGLCAGDGFRVKRDILQLKRTRTMTFLFLLPEGRKRSRILIAALRAAFLPRSFVVSLDRDPHISSISDSSILAPNLAEQS